MCIVNFYFKFLSLIGILYTFFFSRLKIVRKAGLRRTFISLTEIRQTRNSDMLFLIVNFIYLLIPTF